MCQNIYILTLFKEYFNSPFENSILKKAISFNKMNIKFINLREYAIDNYGSVDDEIYGGGPGMLLRPEPAESAINNTIKQFTQGKSINIYMSPKGEKLNQKLCEKLYKYKNLLILTGRYEGIDQRIIDKHIDLELSIGDYILPDGESASLILLECLARLHEGIVGKMDSVVDDTFTTGKLEAPHYTRPNNYKGTIVPKILLSGNHEEIRKWRLVKSLEITYNKRPDLLIKNPLNKEEKKMLKLIFKKSIIIKDEQN